MMMIGVRRVVSEAVRRYGTVTTGVHAGKPCADLVLAPADRFHCDLTGYLPIHTLSEYVFDNRPRLYQRINHNQKHAELFTELRRLNSLHQVFVSTVRNQLNDNLYSVKWRKGLDQTSLLLRVQLLHMGRTSYSLLNQLVHRDDPDHRLATLTHHVTLVDPSTRRPIPVPTEFMEKMKDWSLVDKLPYRVELSEPGTDVHEYRTIVRRSDLDIYRHVKHTVYMKYVMDAVYCSVERGHLSEYVDGEGVVRVEDFLMRYVNESVEGDQVVMSLWEGPGGVVNVRMSVDGQVVNECLITAKNHKLSTDLYKSSNDHRS